MPQVPSDPVIAPRWRASYGRGLGLAMALLCVAPCIVLGGCSVPLADLPVIGMPAGAPARPAPGDAAAYPAVHDMPEARSEPVLDPAEQAKVEKDLKSARDRQSGGATGSSSKSADKTAEKASNKNSDQ